MIKKLGLFTAICLSAVYGGQAAAADAPQGRTPQSPGQVYVRPKLKMPKSIIVCRAKQCAPAHLSTAKEYIYNTLLHMFDSNARQKALVCQGDANTHACTEEFVTVPVTVGITPAYLYIDDVKIADVSVSQKNTMALNLLLNWGVSYNGQTPVCRPAKTLLYVKNVNNVIMEDNGYSCKMTTIGDTTVSTMIAVDYIDLDYGYIGGYYSIGLSGPANGGGSGYMILRLPEDITVEAKDFDAGASEPKTEETVEETIEEIPAGMPSQSAMPAAASPAVQFSQTPAAVPSVAPVQAQPVVSAAPVAAAPVNAASAQNNGTRYIYDSATGQYLPVETAAAPAYAQPQAAAPQAVSSEPFRYAATAHRSYGSAVTDHMPTDSELMSGVYNAPSPQVYQQPAPQPQGQYVYDPATGTYTPLNGQYVLDPQTGKYVPAAPQQAVPQAPREPQAPDVSTIIKYNHPAREYEEAKAAAAAEAERKRAEEKKQKEIEAKAVDFAGVKVYPIPSSNADRTTQEPTLKNALSEYNNQNNEANKKKNVSRRYE